MSLPELEPVAILLAGGRGTRIRDRHPMLPKPLIPCGGRPFIEWVIRHFANNGLTRFVVSLGHLAEVAEEHFRTRPQDGLSIDLVREPAPLGTGGGLRWAWRTIPERDVVVANADSLVLVDLRAARMLFDTAGVDGVVVGVEQDDASRYGTLRVGPNNRLLAFEEKRPGSGLVNAGIYFLRSRLLESISAETPLSLETDVIPRWIASGGDIRVFACRAPFLDIGTPESLDSAEAFLATHWAKGTGQ